MIDRICNDIFDSIWDWCAEEEYDPKGQLFYRPAHLADVWLDDPGNWEQKEHIGNEWQRQERHI